MKPYLLIIILLSLSMNVFADENNDLVNHDLANTYPPAVTQEKEKTLPVDFSLILTSYSKHLTKDFSPPQGYNEEHRSLGFDIEKHITTGFVPGITAFHFYDSYDKSSKIVLGTAGYKKSFTPDLNVSCGISAGFVETSYYSGFIATPFIEGCIYFLCPQMVYFPELPGESDSFIALQFKLKILGGLFK